MNKDRPPRRGRRYPRGRRLSDVEKPKRPKHTSRVRKPKQNSNDLGDLARYKRQEQSPEKIYGGGRGGSRINPWSQRGQEDNQEDLQNNPFAQNMQDEETGQNEPDFDQRSQGLDQDEDYGLPNMDDGMPDYGDSQDNPYDQGQNSENMNQDGDNNSPNGSNRAGQENPRNRSANNSSNSEDGYEQSQNSDRSESNRNSKQSDSSSDDNGGKSDRNGSDSDSDGKDDDSDNSDKNSDKDGKDADSDNNSDSNSKDDSDSDNKDKDKDKDSDDPDSDKNGKDSDKGSDTDGDSGADNGKGKDNDSDNDKDKDKDDKGGKDGKGLKDKLNPLNKLKKGKKFKDFLKAQKKKNRKQDRDKMKDLTSKVARLLQRAYNIIRLYTQAMRLFTMYKIAMALKAAISWITNIAVTVVTFVTSAIGSAISFVASLTAGIWAAIVAGFAVLCLIGMLIFGAIFQSQQEQRQHMLSMLYQAVCVNGDTSAMKGHDSSGDETDDGKSSSHAGLLTGHPVDFKIVKGNNRQTAINLSKAVAKEVGHGVKPEWIFGQIYAEEGTFITGGDLQPVVTQDHNLTGIGAVYIKGKGAHSGSQHGDGADRNAGYGHYDNFHDYAGGYVAILKNDLKGYKPKNGHDFVTHLKAKGYMEASLASYLPGFDAGVANYKHGKAGGAATGDTGESGSNSGESKLQQMADDFCKAMGKKEDDSTGKGWVWPFKGATYKYVMEHVTGEQRFGASSSRKGGFHDGVDFGTVPWNHKYIRAIHDGKVVRIAHEGYSQNDLGWYVVVHSNDGWNVVYQEFAFSSGDKDRIKVHKGQHINPGDKIGYLEDTDGVTHVHIGMTKKPFDTALAHSFDHDGGWVDPIKYIHEHYGLKKGGSGSDTEKGGSAWNPDHLSKSELDAREWIVKRESGGNWNVRNPKGYYGRYQLSPSYLKGDKSKLNQSKTADKYVKSRYGSWKKAKKYWQSHGSY